ncbi:MAG TPA: sugar phosphate isomerase/epimerase [Clostridiales bacterium]|nr:sugar phosphate isomerase/epimerase [Clostridiales bacterium]
MAKFILSAFADEAGKTLLEQIDALKANNFTALEPRGLDKGNISTYTPQMCKEVKKILDDNGIIVSSMGSPFGKINIHDDFNAHFDSFKVCVENANILGTNKIRMFSFYKNDDEKWEDLRDDIFEKLDIMATYSLKNGVLCCHENEKDIYGDTDTRCLDILKTFEGKIRGVFDPANFIQCGVQILPAYEMLAPYIEYMHIKDGRYADGSITPPGKGDGNLVELLRLFNKAEGEKFLTLEPHLKVFAGLSELEKEGGTADVLKDDYTYPTNRDAFNAAANALHEVLAQI